MTQVHDVVVRAGRLLATPGQAGFVPDAWIAIDGGRITSVGTGAAPAAVTLHDHRADVVLPGFINTHSHLIGALVRGLGGDRTTRIDAAGDRPTVRVRIGMTRDDAHAAARLAILELLLSGVTTVADSQPALRGREDQADGTLTALAESGMRAVFFRSSIDRTDFFPPEVRDSPQLAMEELTRLAATYTTTRVTVGAEAMALHRVSDTMLDMLIGHAASGALPFGIHGPYDDAAAAHARNRFGRSVVAELAARGAVDDRLLMYHPVRVDTGDIDVLAAGRAGVAVCAVDNMLIGTTAVPIVELLDGGVRVGLGLDQPNDGHDMFQLMKVTILQQRAALRSAAFGSPELALELATSGGARALRIDDEVGTIEPGKAADLVALDGTHPTLHPQQSALSNIVYAAGPAAVRSVYLEGRRVVHEGRHTDWDHAEIVVRADEAYARCAAGG